MQKIQFIDTQGDVQQIDYSPEALAEMQRINSIVQAAIDAGAIAVINYRELQIVEL